MIEIAQAAGLGLGLGVVTGMPLGVVNVAIVDAAIAGRLRFATGVGLGGALADAVHAAVAAIGVGQLVLATPGLQRWLAIGAAVLIVGYAIGAWRAKREHRAPSDDSSLARGVLTGCALTLPNPGALAAWVAVAAVLWPDASIAEAILFAIGVGIGSAIWFAALARWVARVRSDHPALLYVPRIALVALIAIAGIGVARAF